MALILTTKQGAARSITASRWCHARVALQENHVEALGALAARRLA